MSPKAAKPAKKEIKAAKAEKKPAAKAPAKAATGKAAKAAAPEPLPEGTPAEPGVDLEELEEQQAEAASSSSNSNAAALAAATGAGEMSASFKNFRHHPDMENFYRFIYDNDLRHEALAIIDQIMVAKKNRKLTKHGKPGSV